MTHNEQRVYLINELLKEDDRYQQIEIPDGEKEQRDLLRSLMNVRMPRPIGQEFLKILTLVD